MNTTIFLIRHGESLKNTLNAYSTISGKEPLTKYGKYQAGCAADYLTQYLSTNRTGHTALYSAPDKRSLNSAEIISQKLHIPVTTLQNLSTFTGPDLSGKLADNLYNEQPEFGRSVQLYRAGLMSAYDVPWPDGKTVQLERDMDIILKERFLNDDTSSIIVSHKSIITCLAILLLKKYGSYPENYYGYVDIPTGTGLLFEIRDSSLNVTKLDFAAAEKKSSTDVVLRDGIIVFPQSACAVCWKSGRLLLTRQKRPQAITWELPGGKINSGENFIEAAARELFEETGVRASGGRLIYSLDLDLSISFHRTHLVEFENIDETEEKKVAKWVSYGNVGEMIARGEITHAPTVVAFLNRHTKERSDLCDI